MNYVNGFAIGDDGRAIIEDAAAAGLWQGIPTTAASSNAGAVAGPVKYGNNRVSLDAAGKLFYIDHIATPYAGKVNYNGGMPFAANGALLCDSTSPVKTYEGGLPFAANGYLCIKASAPPPPPTPEKPGIPVPVWGTVTDTSIAMQFPEVSGTKPITYWAEVKAFAVPAVQMQLDVVYASQDVFGKLIGLSPGTGYTVSLYATNTAGSSAKTATKSFETSDSMKPAAPVLNAVYPAKTSLVFAFTYPQNLEPEFYTAYASDGATTIKAEVFDPDQDTLLDGLTEGKEYTCWVTATSAEGLEGPKSNEIKMTCKTVIPAPTLKSITAGDGMAIVEYDTVSPPQPWVVDHYSYAATNVNKPEDPEIEGYITYDSHNEEWTIVLPNDVTWSVAICAVCNPGLAPGDFSARMTVSPEKPRVPYTPVINTAYVQSDGKCLVKWSKGLNGQNGKNSSGLDIDFWNVEFTSVDKAGADFALSFGDVATRECLSQALTVGQWSVRVQAHNQTGWSAFSTAASVNYTPTKESAFMGGVAFDDGVYQYLIFNSGATTGYEALRTATGANVVAEVILVGAGGGGKGQTLLGAKGGNGGGGQLVISTLPAAGVAGSIFVTVPNGAKGGSGENPVNTKIKEGEFTIEAVAGKTATDKNDAAGEPKTEVPISWQKLNMFRFLEPGSHFTGGVAVAGEQNFPNATFVGEGGAGTKDSQSGRGGESYVALRWLK